MNIQFTVAVCAKEKHSWSYDRKSEASKQFDIDLPDDLTTLPDFTPMITGVIQAAVAEHKILLATPESDEAK